MIRKDKLVALDVTFKFSYIYDDYDGSQEYTLSKNLTKEEFREFKKHLIHLKIYMENLENAQGGQANE